MPSMSIIVCLVAISCFYTGLRTWLVTVVPTRNDPTFAPKSDYGLVLFEPLISMIGPGVDIIFVHGLGSNPDTTWLSHNQSYACDRTDNDYIGSLCHTNPGKEHVNWATDLFYDELPSSIQGRTRLFFYNYDSFWMRDGIEERRARLGHELFEQVADNCANDPERRLVFVAHSYGGLVVKEALVAAHTFKNHRTTNIFENSRAIMFLGTPHRGSKESRLGLQVARILKFFWLGATPEILDAITYDSPELRDMHRRFEAISQDLVIVNFFETIKLSNLWGLYKTFAVDEASATLDRPKWQNIPLRTNHTGLNKFYQRDSQYKRVGNKLKYIVEQILEGEPSEIVVHDVPPKLGKEYIEREELSSEIEQNLDKPGKSVAILGMDGMGKTQLALRYAEKHKNRYNIILWIDATSNETILSSFRRCAQALRNSRPKFPDTKEHLGFSGMAHVVLNWLQQRDKRYGETLLIFDNMDEFSTGIRDLIPQNLHGSIIVTGQNVQSLSMLPDGIHLVNVTHMTPGEAQSLLLQHLELKPFDVPEPIKELSLRICKAMFWSPLAIHLAGAQLSLDNPGGQLASLPETKRSLENFLHDNESHKDDECEAETMKGMSQYSLTVNAALDSILTAIDNRFPNVKSRLFLEFMASIGTTEFPIEVFEFMAKGLNKGVDKILLEVPHWVRNLFPIDERYKWDDFNFRQTLGPLLRFGLVDYSRSKKYMHINMHPLVRWKAGRDGLDRTDTPPYNAINAQLHGHVVSQVRTDDPFNTKSNDVLDFIGINAPGPESFTYGSFETTNPVLEMIAEQYKRAGRYKDADSLCGVMYADADPFRKNCSRQRILALPETVASP